MRNYTHLWGDRPRRIVKLAHSEVKNRAAKAWFFEDERGMWEKHAAELLDLASTKPVWPTLTEEQVDLEIAGILVLQALEALIVDAKKVMQEKAIKLAARQLARESRQGRRR